MFQESQICIQDKRHDVHKNCVFGYKLNDERKMVIDEPAAETVRLIFSLAQQGKSQAEIVRRLYADKRPTTSEHKKDAVGFSCVWHSSTVRVILCNEQYIGTFIAGKMRTPEVGGKLQIKVPESEWIKIPGHHPAIVEPAMFASVNERLANKSPPNRNRKRKTVTQRTCAVDFDGLSAKLDRQAEHEKLLAQATDEKQRLYERFVLGEIGADEYRTVSAEIDARLAGLVRG